MSENQRVLAMFDILGFKALRSKIGSLNLKALYHSLVVKSCNGIIANNLSGWNKIFQGGLSSDPVRFSFFSDTIIIYADNDDWLSHLFLLKCCHEIMLEAFRLKVPLRGSLVVDELIVDGNIIVGSAIEKAYEIEQKQVWSGLVTDDRFVEWLTRDGYSIIDYFSKKDSIPDELIKVPEVLKYDVSVQKTKNGIREYSVEKLCVLDWASDLDWGVAARAFRDPQSAHARKIVLNTLAFEADVKAGNTTKLFNECFSELDLA